MAWQDPSTVFSLLAALSGGGKGQGKQGWGGWKYGVANVPRLGPQDEGKKGGKDPGLCGHCGCWKAEAYEANRGTDTACFGCKRPKGEAMAPKKEAAVPPCPPGWKTVGKGKGKGGK